VGKRPYVADDRRCGQCGAELDPIDWCADCKAGRCTTHRRLKRSARAAFCDSACRARFHYLPGAVKR